MLVILDHGRRTIRHVNVTAQPTAAWVKQQLREAFPFDDLPHFLLFDNDTVFGSVKAFIESLGITPKQTSFRSPWQNGTCERVIGTLRRECFDHVIVVHEAHARRLLREYLAHYHDDRTHPAWTRTARADARRIPILVMGPRLSPTPEWAGSITATPGSARPDVQKEPRRPDDAGRRERGLLRKTKIGNSPTLLHGP